VRSSGVHGNDYKYGKYKLQCHRPHHDESVTRAHHDSLVRGTGKSNGARCDGYSLEALRPLPKAPKRNESSQRGRKRKIRKL